MEKRQDREHQGRITSDARHLGSMTKIFRSDWVMPPYDVQLGRVSNHAAFAKVYCLSRNLKMVYQLGECLQKSEIKCDLTR